MSKNKLTRAQKRANGKLKTQIINATRRDSIEKELGRKLSDKEFAPFKFKHTKCKQLAGGRVPKPTLSQSDRISIGRFFVCP